MPARVFLIETNFREQVRAMTALIVPMPHQSDTSLRTNRLNGEILLRLLPDQCSGVPPLSGKSFTVTCFDAPLRNSAQGTVT